MLARDNAISEQMETFRTPARRSGVLERNVPCEYGDNLERPRTTNILRKYDLVPQ